MQTSTKKLIKDIYLYLVSFVALMMIIIPIVSLLNQTLKTFIFKQADNYSYEMPRALGCSTDLAKTDTSVKQLSAEECSKLEEKDLQKEKERLQARRQADYAQNISFLIVSIPLFAIHWYYARKKED